MQVSDYARVLLKIEVWREMRSVPEAWAACAWVVLNRAAHPSWWGKTVAEVITHKWQFSSMTAPGDPNLVQWPQENALWEKLSDAVDYALAHPLEDATKGAVYYFTPPLTEPPAQWGHVRRTVVIGPVQFFVQE